jgi:hypothetical protein
MPAYHESQSDCGIEVRHRYLAEKINTDCNAPTKGANAINGSPNLPPNLASTTTEPDRWAAAITTSRS